MMGNVTLEHVSLRIHRFSLVRVILLLSRGWCNYPVAVAVPWRQSYPIKRVMGNYRGDRGVGQPVFLGRALLRYNRIKCRCIIGLITFAWRELVCLLSSWF